MGPGLRPCVLSTCKMHCKAWADLARTASIQTAINKVRCRPGVQWRCEARQPNEGQSQTGTSTRCRRTFTVAEMGVEQLFCTYTNPSEELEQTLSLSMTWGRVLSVGPATTLVPSAYMWTFSRADHGALTNYKHHGTHVSCCKMWKAGLYLLQRLADTRKLCCQWPLCSASV